MHAITCTFVLIVLIYSLAVRMFRGYYAVARGLSFQGVGVRTDGQSGDNQNLSDRCVTQFAKV